MGIVTSLPLLYPANVCRENFMIYYLLRKGAIIPGVGDLIPGGGLKKQDDPAVARHKFKAAIKKQKQLKKALRELDAGVPRCLSPCLITDFDMPKSGKTGTFSYTYPSRKCSRQESRVAVPPASRPSQLPGRMGFGALERLVSSSLSKKFRTDACSEEILSINMGSRAQRQQRGSKKPSKEVKRSKSRPETIGQNYSVSSQRLARSVTAIRSEDEDSVSGVSQTKSEVVIEKIELAAKKSKRFWPPREHLKNVMKDPKNRPTTYFLARFRCNPNSEFIEVDYRYNKDTRKESFACKGSLETLLNDEVRSKYRGDKTNNNATDKDIFFQNVVSFFNNLEGRIWWNGYVIMADSPPNQRLRLNSLQMNPPDLVFDMTGLNHVSATRNFSKLNLMGTKNEGDDVARSFTFRGKTEHDVARVKIKHIPDTFLVSVGLPLLSGVVPGSVSFLTKDTIQTKSSKAAIKTSD